MTWTAEKPTKTGWYLYRGPVSHGESVITKVYDSKVFDPIGNGFWKAWDWNQGRFQFCSIEIRASGTDRWSRRNNERIGERHAR
jgi:hypothetical protein